MDRIIEGKEEFLELLDEKFSQLKDEDPSEIVVKKYKIYDYEGICDWIKEWKEESAQPDINITLTENHLLLDTKDEYINQLEKDKQSLEFFIIERQNEIKELKKDINAMHRVLHNVLSRHYNHLKIKVEEDNGN